MTQEMTTWSAGVRLYGKNNRAIEDMTIENFPATSKANAHAYAIQKGLEHLKELGLSADTGVSIFFIEEHTSGEKGKGTALKLVQNNAAKNGNNKAAKDNKPRVKYKPFTCPVSSLCSSHYLGVKENGVFNVVKKPKET